MKSLAPHPAQWYAPAPCSLNCLYTEPFGLSVPDFLATRNCSAVRIFFHSSSDLTTFSVGSVGAVFDVSMVFFLASSAWHDVRDTARKRMVNRWLILFIARVGVI